MNVQLLARIMKDHSLTDVMIAALLSGEVGGEVRAGGMQRRALVKRGLLDAETNLLTYLGNLLVRAMEGEELSPQEMEDISVTTASEAAEYFVLHVPGKDPVIRPWSEAPEGAEALSFSDAREVLVEDAISHRDYFRDVLKSVRALRPKDIRAAAPAPGTTEATPAPEMVDAPA